MKAKLNINQNTLTFNQCVHRAYAILLKQTKALLSTIEEEPLRYMLIRTDKSTTVGSIIHELVSPLLYLRLEVYAGNIYGIHYGYELSPSFGQYYNITSTFIRLVYKLTMVEATTINIESSIRTDWMITNCADMYEHIEERNRHHTFQLVPYKVKRIKRKLQKVA